MPKWLKITLIVCVTGFFLLILGGGIFFFIYVNSDEGKKMLKDVQHLVKDSEQTAVQVEKFAKKGTLEDCVTEAKKKLDACSDMFCYIQVKLFTKTCLLAVKPEGRNQFCKGVPKEMEKMVQWDLDYCMRYKPKSKEEHETCGRMLAQEIFNYCQMSDESN